LNWRCVAGSWRLLKRRARRWGRPGKAAVDMAVDTRQASEKQLADWAAGRHDVDPIHK
jgi:hypothetical protein